MAERLARLPDDARTLLEVIAVAGRPLPAKSFFEAARVTDGNDALQALVEEHLKQHKNDP